MKTIHPKMVALLLLVGLCASTMSVISGDELLGFSGQSMKLRFNPKPDEKKVDQIFKLLSGLDEYNEEPKDGPYVHQSKDSSTSTTVPIKFQDDLDNEKEENEIESKYEDIFSDPDKFPDYSPSMLMKYIKLANKLSPSGTAATDIIEDVVGTVKKVTIIYKNELEKRLRHNENDSHARLDENDTPLSLNRSHSNVHPEGNDSIVQSFHSNQNVEIDEIPLPTSQQTFPLTQPEDEDEDGFLDSASNLLDTLLQPENVEKIYDVGVQAKSEDEILEQLVSIIVGVEDRGGGYGHEGGYGLTKDPVTIIALLALAAYLLRAAVEFLRANAMGKRSVDLFGYTELQETAMHVLQLIGKAKLEYESEERVDSKDSTTWTSESFDILKLLNLQRTKDVSCFRRHLCDRLAGKSLQELGAVDAMWIGAGLYEGDRNMTRYLYRDSKSVCEKYYPLCESPTKQENCVSCPLQFLKEMKIAKIILNFLNEYNVDLNSFSSYWT